MDAYATAGWANFFVAEVSATAALSGLLFVAVSISLAKVLASPQLPGRAIEALVVLVSMLVVGMFGLVPGQHAHTLGIEILSVGVLAWGWSVLLQLASLRVPTGVPRRWIVLRAFQSQVATIPTIVAGASLIAGSGGGLYWLVASLTFAITTATTGAWVLLVEIQR